MSWYKEGLHYFAIGDYRNSCVFMLYTHSLKFTRVMLETFGTEADEFTSSGMKKSGKSDVKFCKWQKFSPTKISPDFFYPTRTLPRLFCTQLKKFSQFFQVLFHSSFTASVTFKPLHNPLLKHECAFSSVYFDMQWTCFHFSGILTFFTT